MYYSTIGALGIFVLIFENHDIIFKKKKDIESKAWKVYKSLLMSVLFFYVTDIGWGISEYFKNRTAQFVDTQFYFLAMGLCVLFLTQFVIRYMHEKSVFGTILLNCGRIFCAAITIIVALNSFGAVLFWIDDKARYQTTELRLFMLVFEIVLLAMVSLFAVCVTLKRNDSYSNRYKTIAYFGIITSVFLFVQIWYPLLPLYATAYLLGTSLLHSFVVSNEKEEYKRKLEMSLQREKEQLEELKSAKFIAYRDALTGVKSKSAYVEAEQQKNILIQNGNAEAFAVVVFDINDLKKTNDTYGHDKGDELIRSGCRIICQKFKHSPVFRIGGDEFVAILERDEYLNRESLMNEFNQLMENRKEDEQVVVSMGMAEYVIGKDSSFNEVFTRADHNMYERKHILKMR